MIKRLRKLKQQHQHHKMLADFDRLSLNDRRFLLATLRHWSQHPRRWWFIDTMPCAWIIGGP